MDQYGQPRRSPTLKRPAFDDHYASSSNTGRVGNGGASGSATPQPDIGSVASGDKQYDEGEDGSEPGAGGGSGGGGGQGGKRSRASGGGAAPPPLKRGSACSLCRKRKLRCDGVRPRCGTCLRLNHECQYGDPAQEKMQEKQRELEERCRALEAELEAYRRNGPPSSAPTAASSTPSSSSVPTPYSYPSSSKLSPATVPVNLQQQQQQPQPAPSSHRPSQQSHQELASPAFPPPPPALVNYSPYASSAVPANLGSYSVVAPPPPSQSDSPYFSQPQQHPHQYQQPYPSQVHSSPLGSSFPPNQPQATSYLSSASYPLIQRRDSEAFPLPPHLSQQSSSLDPLAGRPSIVGVQSFPFPMSNTTPHLADLVNPHPSPLATSAGSGPSPALGRGVGGGGGGGGGYGMDGETAGGGVRGNELTNLWGQELPELDLMLDLADLYFTTLHSHLPFLHQRRFLYTLHHPSSLSSPPSLSLIFAVLALSAPYHDNPAIRAHSTVWYGLARQKVELSIAAGLRPSGTRVASLTVEMVQALCLLSMLEMGQSDHQRAFLSLGQAVRIAAMLGLQRMDEDRVSERTGQMGDKRLRPPALHQLPSDGVLLEECRRTMAAVFVLDRWESATTGWPSAISETDIRVLLPCSEELYSSGTVSASGSDNPLWWPADDIGTSAEAGWAGIKAEDDVEELGGGGGGGETEGGAGGAGQGGGGGFANRFEKEERAGKGGKMPKVSTFAWLCRVVWLGGRIQGETYRASGPPAGGPWNKHVNLDPLSEPSETLEMDRVLDYIRNRFGALAASRARADRSVEGGLLLILVITNCCFVNLFHLNAASGLSQYPWDPTAPIYIGSAEYSMRRCWEAVHSLKEILGQLAGYENGRTTLHRSRATTFTAFIPYILYSIAFPAKFAIGDWSSLVHDRGRSENLPAHVAASYPGSGDDVFPASYYDERIAYVDCACEAMERIGVVWPIGQKFATMIRQDRNNLVQRTYERQQAEAQAAATAGHSNGLGLGLGNGSVNGGGSVPSDASPYGDPHQQLFPSPVGGQHNVPLHSTTTTYH